MNQLFRKILNTSKPGELSQVININHEKETSPEQADMTTEGANAIWNSVIELYNTGTQPAITFCLRRRGKIIFNRSIGYAKGNGPQDRRYAERQLATPETPVCLFSASKAITALLMHMLAEDGAIDLLDPVSFYVPEFGQNGKKNTTLHQILSHRGGIPRLATGMPVETLWDQDAVWKMLCEAEPNSMHGNNLSYHALTGGFVLQRVLEKATGGKIEDYLDQKIRQPMGMEYFTYGINEEKRSRMATNYATGPKPRFPLTMAIKRALGADMETIEKAINTPQWYGSVMPAGNLVGTAEEVSRFYQMMLNGGEWEGKRICSENTIRRAIQEVGTLQFDKTLLIPMRYSAGLMLGGSPVGMWGKNSASAYGHIGLLNKLCWADPDRDISVALLTSGIPIIAHHIPALFGFVNNVTRHCRYN